jgi:hypothetical protein
MKKVSVILFLVSVVLLTGCRSASGLKGSGETKSAAASPGRTTLGLGPAADDGRARDTKLPTRKRPHPSGCGRASETETRNVEPRRQSRLESPKELRLGAPVETTRIGYDVGDFVTASRAAATGQVGTDDFCVR